MRAIRTMTPDEEAVALSMEPVPTLMHRVAVLRGEGVGIRAIAEQLDTSTSYVHESLAHHREATCWHCKKAKS